MAAGNPPGGMGTIYKINGVSYTWDPGSGTYKGNGGAALTPQQLKQANAKQQQAKYYKEPGQRQPTNTMPTAPGQAAMPNAPGQDTMPDAPGSNGATVQTQDGMSGPGGIVMNAHRAAFGQPKTRLGAWIRNNADIVRNNKARKAQEAEQRAKQIGNRDKWVEGQKGAAAKAASQYSQVMGQISGAAGTGAAALTAMNVQDPTAIAQQEQQRIDEQQQLGNEYAQQAGTLLEQANKLDSEADEFDRDEGDRDFINAAGTTLSTAGDDQQGAVPPQPGVTPPEPGVTPPEDTQPANDPNTSERVSFPISTKTYNEGEFDAVMDTLAKQTGVDAGQLKTVTKTTYDGKPNVATQRQSAVKQIQTIVNNTQISNADAKKQIDAILAKIMPVILSASTGHISTQPKSTIAAGGGGINNAVVAASQATPQTQGDR